MKTLSTLFLLAVILVQLGCSRSESGSANTENASLKAHSSNASVTDQAIQPVSLTAADSAETVTAAMDRKIIKNAELILEVVSPNDVQGAILSIAESNGGFVVTSETKQTENTDPAKRRLEVKLIARVPATHFDSAVTAMEKLAINVIHRSMSGNDVTEEFIDLEARIRTQKALELQFIQIMKQAGNISDAMDVQRQIAGVRTEIEKLEGRKRFLENRATLSTITVELRTPVVIAVSTSSFGRNLRESVSQGVDVASTIVLGITHFFIVMIPIVVLIILPLGLLVSIFVRRARRMRLSDALPVAPVSE
jgi:Domain of unknown function (DUF4349)